MKRAGARTRTWTVALTDAEWTLAEAVRAQYGRLAQMLLKI